MATAARLILTNYGGNKFTVRGRGDMSAEVGDVDILELTDGLSVSARRYKQQLKLFNGIMKNLPSYYIQATGNDLYQQHVVITQSGSWTAPTGVTRVKIILVAGGAGGESGTDGTWDADGAVGAGGLAGKIAIVTATINAGQTFGVQIGAGGEPGQPGGETTVGNYTTAGGTRFDGYADILSGLAFGLDGKAGVGGDALPNTGNGGGGGAAGQRGITGWDGSKSYIGRYPTPGKPGGHGGSGCVVIYYDI